MLPSVFAASLLSKLDASSSYLLFDGALSAIFIPFIIFQSGSI
jgi:hypothetical protein